MVNWDTVWVVRAWEEAWKSRFCTDGSSLERCCDPLMPEVMMLFFYTMAFRWRPCITLLFPDKLNKFLLLAKRCQRFIYWFFFFKSQEKYFKTILCDVCVCYGFFFFFTKTRSMLALRTESDLISDTIIKGFLCSRVFKDLSHVRICNGQQIRSWAENLFCFCLFF